MKTVPLLRLAISIVALFIVFQNIDLHELKTQFSEIDMTYVVPLIFISALTWVVRSWRLQTIMSNQDQKVSLLTCFQGRGVEVFVNLFMPLRGGDMARCFILSKLMPNTSVPRQVGYYTIEKLAEILSVMTIFFAFFFSHDYASLDRFKIPALAIMGVVGLCVLYFLYSNKLSLQCGTYGSLLYVVSSKLQTLSDDVKRCSGPQ